MALAAALPPASLRVTKSLMKRASQHEIQTQMADEARHIYGDFDGLEFCDSTDDAVQGANALAIVTEWKNFWSPDFSSLAEKLADKAIFDGRNLYEPNALKPFGLRYFAIGRGESLA